ADIEDNGGPWNFSRNFSRTLSFYEDTSEMSSVIRASLCRTLLSVSFVLFASADQRIIQAEPGRTAMLPCRVADNKLILVVEWSRADVKSEHVLLYRDEQIDPEKQHFTFRNRADLQDRQMKDGDVSLVLDNVRSDDRGTYECRVIQKGGNRRKRAALKTEPICIFRLEVLAHPAGDMLADDGGGHHVDTNPIPIQDGNVAPPADQTNITAEPGQNITLPCRAPGNKPCTAAEWSRTDLEPEYVLHYRHEQILPSLQHPSFKNRVDLQDRQMKDGDASLVLKNVSTDDRGTYQCQVTQKRSTHRKRTILKPDLISTVYLDVAPSSPPGNKDGSDGLIPSLLILTLCVAALVGLVIYEKKQGSLSRLC
ncbi:hypothetical protein AMECASPLE_035605, partial [Ameca splendens]